MMWIIKYFLGIIIGILISPLLFIYLLWKPACPLGGTRFATWLGKNEGIDLVVLSLTDLVFPIVRRFK